MNIVAIYAVNSRARCPGGVSDIIINIILLSQWSRVVVQQLSVGCAVSWLGGGGDDDGDLNARTATEKPDSRRGADGVRLVTDTVRRRRCWLHTAVRGPRSAGRRRSNKTPPPTNMPVKRLYARARRRRGNNNIFVPPARQQRQPVPRDGPTDDGRTSTLALLRGYKK